VVVRYVACERIDHGGFEPHDPVPVAMTRRIRVDFVELHEAQAPGILLPLACFCILIRGCEREHRRELVRRHDMPAEWSRQHTDARLQHVIVARSNRVSA
jgi:hypothetical protein